VWGLASADNKSGVFGVNLNAAGWAGYFQGRVGITGALDCTGCVVENGLADGVVSQAKLGATGAAAGTVLGTDGSSLQWLVPPQGTITGVTPGTGLEGGGTSGDVTVGITTGGVGTLQLADGAVTQTKIEATGGSAGQVLGTDGATLRWQADGLTLPLRKTADAFTLFELENEASSPSSWVYAATSAVGGGLRVNAGWIGIMVASQNTTALIAQTQSEHYPAVNASGPTTGVHGSSDFGVGVVGYHGPIVAPPISAGVYGHSADLAGVLGMSETGVGIMGGSSSGSGVLGYSGQGPGVTGRSLGGSPGVAGYQGPNTGDAIASGVYGRSDSTWGVYGTSDSGNGVYAFSAGGGRDYAALRADNGNSSGGMAGYFTNSSDYATAHFANGDYGGVLYLQGEGGPFIRAVNSSETDDKFRIEGDGTVYADGSYNCGLKDFCFNSGAGADLAERIDVTGSLEPGDVVEIDPDRPSHFRRSSRALSTAVAGVVSTSPAMTMNNNDLAGNDSGKRSDTRPLLALVGQIPVRATAEGGPIAPGDLLVASSTPGHAMKVGATVPLGAVIGKALGRLESGTGLVPMLVMLR
jgi:hypothetical protein